MNKKVGLVTVLFNSADVLPGFFASLIIQSYKDYWLYIIDNSLDNASYEAAELLIQKFGLTNVTLIKNQVNVGVAAANNQGIKLSLEAGCQYVLLLNNDIEFKDVSLLTKMVTLADTRQEKLVVPKIYFHDTGLIWYAGGTINKWKGTTSHRGEGESDCLTYDNDCYTNYAPTCFMLLHKDVFEQVGMMDEKYFVYYDDTDFVWRSNAAGFRIYYWACGHIWHKVSNSTGGAESPFSVFYLTRNRVYFILKNLSLFYASISILYFIVTRFFKWFLYSNELRKKLAEGLVSGYTLKKDVFF